MRKTLVLLGASIFMFGALNGGAEARKVHYEINGKRYSYSTNNKAQTAEAMKRIAAAKAAEDTKAKADAEKSSHPLRAVFGSDTQKEAAKAQEKLQQILSNGDQDTASTPSSPEGREGSRTKKRGAANMASITQAPRQPVASVQEAAAVAEPMVIRGPSKVKSISFDVETGIKTTFMVDGTIVEEPFDSSVLASLAHEDEEKNSLMAFVKQLRKAAPEDMTGSIRTSVAEPQSAPTYWHR